MKRSKKKNAIPTSDNNDAIAYYKEYGLANLVGLLTLLAYTVIK